MEKNDASSWDESFNSESANWNEISSWDEIFIFLHVIVICFLYWKQWQGKMKFQLGCVIIISSPGEIFSIISPLGATFLIFTWKHSNVNCALLAGTISQSLPIPIIHMETSLKFLVHFMMNVSPPLKKIIKTSKIQ